MNETELTAADRDALTRAIAVARVGDKGRREQIDAKLRDGPWLDAARFAAYCAQARALDLRPWQSPLFRANLDDLDKPFGDPRAARECAELLKRLLDAGLSAFEPDPIAALAEAERVVAT